MGSQGEEQAEGDKLIESLALRAGKEERKAGTESERQEEPSLDCWLKGL